jgi:acetyltransferase
MTSNVKTASSGSLSCFFSPASIALTGATDREGSVGCTILRNLLSPSYKGRIYAVNPNRAQVAGLTCYASMRALPEAVDLVIVVTPASTVPQLVAECVSAKAKTVIVISAGFKENGPAGAALEKQIQQELRGSATRLIGPNCLGVMNPLVGLSVTRDRFCPRRLPFRLSSQSS